MKHDDPNPSGLCMCGCGQATRLVRHNDAKNGVFAGHHFRYLRGHCGAKSPVHYVVDPATGCWNWQRSDSGDGYGKIFVNGRRMSSHRYYYETRRWF